jgi:hypothetical protein
MIITYRNSTSLRFSGGGAPRGESRDETRITFMSIIDKKMMKPEDRIRRTAKLCCHCIRNIAFYRAWHELGQPFRASQFWINVNSNFLDVAVLEWCKLFADAKGKHHYGKVTEDPNHFRKALFTGLKIEQSDFEKYLETVRAYRDKFVAHLDNLSVMSIPHLDLAKDSTNFLYQSLLVQEAKKDTLLDAPPSLSDFYDCMLAEGKKTYHGLISDTK